MREERVLLHDALRKRGALPWPSPGDADGLNAVLTSQTKASVRGSVGAPIREPVQVHLFGARGKED
jgi:hypothetical protein